MTERTRREMDAVDINDFLESQHTGVLSMADSDNAYGIPVSFDYDTDRRAVFFRFGFAPESQKRRFLDAVDTVSFTVYAETADGWKSVVVEGHMEEVSESALDSSVAEALNRLDIPYFHVHQRPAGDVDISVYRLDVTTLSGIAESG